MDAMWSFSSLSHLWDLSPLECQARMCYMQDKVSRSIPLAIE